MLARHAWHRRRYSPWICHSSLFFGALGNPGDSSFPRNSPCRKILSFRMLYFSWFRSSLSSHGTILIQPDSVDTHSICQICPMSLSFYPKGQLLLGIPEMAPSNEKKSEFSPKNCYLNHLKPQRSSKNPRFSPNQTINFPSCPNFLAFPLFFSSTIMAAAARDCGPPGSWPRRR